MRPRRMVVQFVLIILDNCIVRLDARAYAPYGIARMKANSFCKIPFFGMFDVPLLNSKRPKLVEIFLGKKSRCPFLDILAAAHA